MIGPSPSLRRDPAEEDRLVQAAVLGFVLGQHPAIMSCAEIGLELRSSGADAVERAIRDLIGAGLLRREGGSTLPTRAALHYTSLRL